MISKQDILDRAGEWQLRPNVVEKDYVLGWVLSALARHQVISKSWVFKGGTCLKKCYFETYRFSEDLDFSLLTSSPYSSEELLNLLKEVARDVYELSGIEIAEDLIVVKPSIDKLQRPTFTARLSYRGPLSPRGDLPRLLFDITQHEPILDGHELQSVHHPYPDELPSDVKVRAYSLNELLAEKTRALYERTRPRDLYDVVFIIDNHREALNLEKVRELLQGKCRAKQISPPTLQQMVDLVTGSDELRSEWANMLAHQLPQLPPLESRLARIRSVLEWIEERPVTPVAALRTVQGRAGEQVVAPAGIRYWGGGGSLETIRFAGANRLMIAFNYHGKARVAAPYSLRRPATGNLLLYAQETGVSHVKAFKVDEIVSLSVTDRAFVPHYQVELTTTGPLHAPAPSRTALPRSYSARSRRENNSYGPTYIFRCPHCDKLFRRKKNNPTLRQHKNKDGWNCGGRRGYLERVE